jgi:hypothetical protein
VMVVGRATKLQPQSVATDRSTVRCLRRFDSPACFAAWLVLDGVYGRDTDGGPVCVKLSAPTDEVLQAVLQAT